MDVEMSEFESAAKLSKANRAYRGTKCNNASDVEMELRRRKEEKGNKAPRPERRRSQYLKYFTSVD